MKYKVWDCKIIISADSELPDGFDCPPRKAVIEAIESAGINVISCFSGWGGKLSKLEKEIIESHNKR